MGARIVECEAYCGQEDEACHASVGKTNRNASLWGPSGHAYVYLIYGIHTMLNIVAKPPGCVGGVLIRAVEPVFGEDDMRQLRCVQKRIQLSNGPGNLCRALGIEMKHNGMDLTRDILKDKMDSTSDIFKDEMAVYEQLDYVVPLISIGPRVGITKAPSLPYRFFITNSPFVSRSKENKK